MAPTILGMDIGGTNLRSGFVNDRYELSGFRISSSQLICGDHAPEKIAAYIRDEIAEAGHYALCGRHRFSLHTGSGAQAAFVHPEPWTA